MARRLVPLLAVALLVGCGGDSPSEAAQEPPSAPPATAADVTQAAAPVSATVLGTKIISARTRFGRMLFDSRKQAIYIFQKDRRNRTNCYGACARAWPPVYTKGAPRAASGVRSSLLGTIRRRDGRRQVTYAGKPLYFYAHEDPGQVLCHNVFLNGGLWWVVGVDGKRRP